jgi:large subunit ribosomal protein L15
MQIHQIKPISKKKPKKRVGRGGKRGTYSGRGSKGQKARAGHRIRPHLRDIIKKLPKKRGYRFPSVRGKPTIVNIKLLEKKFEDGAKITPKALLENKIIVKRKGKIPGVKLLGSGEITKKLLVSECQISEQAKEKIEKAGGKVN